MLSHIAMLESAAERRMEELAGAGMEPRQRGEVMRAAANVRSDLQRARMAEQELLRLEGASPIEIATAIDAGLERGRHESARDLIMGVLAGSGEL